MKKAIPLILSLVMLSGCTTLDSLVCQLSGYDPEELDKCNPEWVIGNSSADETDD